MAKLRNFIEEMIQWQLSQLAEARKSDVMAIYGPMHDELPVLVRDEVEKLSNSEHSNDTLVILLDTGGGFVQFEDSGYECRR